MTSKSTKALADVGERVGWTFAQTFLSQLIISGWFDVGGITDISILQKAGIAGLAAVLSFAKGYAALWVGKKDTASSLPSSLDPASGE